MSEVRDKHPSDETLQAFLDDALSPRERRRVDTHVASCARCAEELESWGLLFEDLGSLAAHRPAADFQARVMAGVQIPAELPWAARAKARVAELVSTRSDHLSSDVLQDFADGGLSSRLAARARTHLDGCDACAHELSGWANVMAGVSRLERLAPSEGFAERVIASLTPAAAAAPVAMRVPVWRRALAVAGRFVPRTRRAWAALAGAAVTPAVTFGLVLYAVFSHPTLTPSALASFVFWQLTDLSVTAWGAFVSGSLSVVRIVGLDGFVDAMLAAPLAVAVGFVMYAIAFIAAVRILYKNLVARRSVRSRYASASAS